MLIEDDPPMLSLLQTLLQMEGFTVIPFAGNITQEEVLGEISSSQPEALIIDVHLHSMNGIKLLEEIKRQDHLKNTRIIMTSGMDLKQECMAAGANGFLLKPYLPDELIKLLRHK